jgi:uncharacterized repeat protein (TIGR01451 family)
LKRFLWLAVIILLVIPQAGVYGSDTSQRILSTFPNNSFEINPNEPSNGWDWPGQQWVWDGGSAHDGIHSARVSRTSGDETASIYSAYVPVQASTIYSLSFWLRTENANKSPTVFIYQYTSDNIQTGIRLIAFANVGDGTTGWSLTSYRFQTMPDATQVRIRVYLYTDTTGTFWFDDFSLDQGNPAVYPFQAGFPVVASGWVYLSSPTVADIDQDGQNELLIGAGDKLNGWDKTGTVLPGYPVPTGDRFIYNQLALGDLNGDGQLEIAAGTRTANPPEGQCRVFVWRPDGSTLNGWPISVDWNPLYSNSDCKVTSVVLADIDGNQDLEILASTTNNASGNPAGGISPVNLYSWQSDGNRAGGEWPTRLTSAGFYGAIAAGDLNMDGVSEIAAGRDHHMLNAYSGTGTSLTGWPIDTYLDANEGDYHTDYRVVHGLSAPVLADLDGNGSTEYIVMGNISGPDSSTVIRNSALLVLNSNGTRMEGWETPALGNGVLTLDDLPQKSPAIADLNGDGKLEIIASGMDGWMRAYDVHKSILWAFDYAQGHAMFASEPVIGDINGDGELEIVFGTYVPVSGGDWNGPVGLWALHADGDMVDGFPLAVPTPGVRAAPTLADLDSDGDVDILAASITGQVFVWDAPGVYDGARLPWPMGRHDLQRSASYVYTFGESRIAGSPISVSHGDTATFVIHISSLSPINDNISLSDPIPAGINFIPGTLTATSGVASEHGGVIQWSGALPDDLTADISYQVSVDTDKTRVIENTVIIDTVIEGLLERTSSLYANLYTAFMPSIRR